MAAIIEFSHLGFSNFTQKNFTHSFWLNLMMAAILNLAILDSAIMVFPLILTPTCQDWFPPFAQKNFTHSFWLNLMMAAILNSAMLVSAMAIMDSDTLLSSLRFPQKHSHSTLALTQTNSIWLTWWWQPSWILSSSIQQFCTQKKFTHSSWLNLMMAPILNSAMVDWDTAILESDTLLSSAQIHSKTLSLHPDSWLKLIQSDSNSIILT